LLAAVVLTSATHVQAQAAGHPPPAISLVMRDTVDVWRNLQGGVAVGYTTLNKAFVGATLNGEAVGLPGFTAHASILKPNDETLSNSRTGDIQTASNIEGVGAVRLFDLWADQQLGGGASLRVGLMDLNETFDSIDPASLFLNSSHGIGRTLRAAA
jgi:porin